MIPSGGRAQAIPAALSACELRVKHDSRTIEFGGNRDHRQHYFQHPVHGGARQRPQ